MNKNLVLFQAFGVLSKIGDVKHYTDKKTQEQKSIQDYKAGGVKFSVFGERQIEFQDKLLGLPVIAFGRVTWRQSDDGNFHQQWNVDSCRKDFSAIDDDFDFSGND